MIINVPTHDDFYSQGITFLNLAWDAIFNLLLDYANAEDWGAIVDDEQPMTYWKAAQKPLATAVALAQQGSEFLLKARIAAVSPFLLFSGKASDWPRGCDKKNTVFSEFHIVDAHDLIRIHDCVAEHRLSEEFQVLYNDLRTKRNTVFHTIDKGFIVSERDIIRAILRISKELIGQQCWPSQRLQYLESTPRVALWQQGGGYQLVREMLICLELLKPAEVKVLLGFNNRQRTYLCPHCHDECYEVDKWDKKLKPKSAQLKPNRADSTSLWCFICNRTFPVVRQSCENTSCRGNVILAQPFWQCLTCYEEQEDMAEA